MQKTTRRRNLYSHLYQFGKFGAEIQPNLPACSDGTAREIPLGVLSVMSTYTNMGQPLPRVGIALGMGEDIKALLPPHTNA